MSSRTELQRDILDRGLFDHVSLGELVADLTAARPEAPVREVLHTCVQAVRPLVELELVEPGVLSDGGFVARPGDLERLVRDVFAAYDGDVMGSWTLGLWLSNTREGDRAARRERGKDPDGARWAEGRATIDREGRARDVLARAREQDVSLSEVTGLVMRRFAQGRPLEEVRDLSCELIRSLVLDGRARVGTLDADGTFVDRGDELETLLRRVEQAYDGHLFGAWREGLWLRATSRSDQAASHPRGRDEPASGAGGATG